MTYTTTDWIWERLSTRYGVTALQQNVEDVFVRWLAEQNTDWGFNLVDYYFNRIPAATNYGDAEYAYWSGGVLREAVAWLDAANALSGEQSARAFGVGGSAYNARYGSATGADSNDPLLLPHTGTNYLYVIDSANRASVPVVASSIIGSGVIQFDVQALVHGTSAELVGTSAANVFAMYVQAGDLRLACNVGGVNRFMNVGACTTGSVMWYRATFDPSTGVANGFQSTDGVTYTATGTTTVAAGSIALFASPIYMGYCNLAVGGSSSIYRATIVTQGVVTLDADFTTGITSGAQTSFTESSVNAATVTINRASSGRKSVAVVRPVWLFGTDDYMEIPADPEGAYVRTAAVTSSGVLTAYTSYDTGTATAGATSTLDDTTKAWTASLYIGRAVRITGGTGVGQVRIITANTATQLTISGTWTTVPDATSTYVIESRGNVNTDFEISVRCSLDNWATGSNQPILSKRATGQYSYQFYMSAGGVIGFTWTSDGNTTSTIGSTVVPFVGGTTYWIRMRRTASTGAYTFDYAADQATEPTSWTTLSSGTGVAGNIWQGTATINIGWSLGGVVAGNFKTVIARDGFAGLAVVYWQASGHPTAANYVNANRVLWQLAGGATVVNANRMNFSNTDSFTVISVQRAWATHPTSGTIISKWGGGAAWNVRNGFGTPTQPLIALNDAVTSQAFASPIPTAGALVVLAYVVTPTQVTTYTNTTAFGPAARTVFDSTASEAPVRIGVTPAGGSYNDFELVSAAVIPRELTATEITAICKLYGTA